MIEKTKTPWEVDPSFALILERANRNRPHIESLAIDNPETKRPEDAIAAQKNGDGSFTFAASIVEAGLLDPDGSRLTRTLADLRNNNPTNHKLPQNLGSFSFAYNSAVPSLTLVGNFRPDRGISDLDLERTAVQPKHYTYNDPELKQNPEFTQTAEFVYAFQKYELEQNPLSKNAKPQKTVQTFANLVNLGVAQLTKEAKLPQLLYIVEEQVEIDGTPHKISLVSPEPVGADGAPTDHIHSGFTAPVRDYRSWVNHVAMTQFMDSGESILTADDALVFADYINNARIRRFARKLERTYTQQLAA